MSELDRATAVVPVGAGRFAVEVDPGFTVGPKPNGGYLLALAARGAAAGAAASGSPHADPLAATAHYLWAPDPGPAELAVEDLRAGRGATQVRTTIEQDGRRCVDVTFTLGTLEPDAGPATWTALPPPPIAAYDDCPRVPAHREGAPFVVSIMDRADFRLDPACASFGAGVPTGRGELRAWLAMADERPVDPLALLFLLDCFPPATLDIAPSGWVPTLSLTAYVRARPAPGPLRARQAALVVRDGRVDEVCEIWDSQDRLVAQATQLAVVRFAEDATVVPHPGPVSG